MPAIKPGKTNSVALAEAAFPGTARWFHNPVWRVLKRETLDAHEVEMALSTLEREVVDLLFVDNPSTPGHARLAFIEARHLQKLVALGSFDSLAAIVLLVQLSTAVGSANLREWALDAYGSIQPLVADAPVTQMNYPELFTLIDRACPHWVHVSPSVRLDLRVFWHELARKGWAQDRMAHIEARLIHLGFIELKPPLHA